MSLFKSKSLLVVLAFSLFCLYFISGKINGIIEKKDTCLCSYDGFGYYMYLPYFFEKGNMDIKKEWAQDLQNEYCNGNEIYQLIPLENGKSIDLYHMGLAFVEAPAYLTGHFFANILDFKTDGFSIPYYISFVIYMFLILFIGLLYLRKLLLLFFNDTISALSLLVILAGSNLFITFYDSLTLPHTALFSLNSIFLYFTFLHFKNKSRSSLIISALILGLTVAIRPTQVLFGIIPLILFYKIYTSKIRYISIMLIYPLMGLLWNIPQILYWKIIGGQWLIPNLHTEDLTFLDPYTWKFLFSYKKGWLVYSPVFAFAFLGFWFSYKKQKTVFLALIAFVVVNIYVLSSWECWWYASSYSSRAMVDSYCVFALGLGFFFNFISNRPILKIISSSILTLLILLNLVQSFQAHSGIIDLERMTKKQYWSVFGKIDPNSISKKFLEIDRSNTEWIRDPQILNEPSFSILHKEVFKFEGNLKSIPNNYAYVGKFHLLEKVPTDESLFEIKIKALTKDSTKSSRLNFHISSIYNFYGWDNVEISKDLKQDQVNEIEFKFNLPPIRHKKDEMVIYIYDDQNCPVEVKSVSIKSYTLIRK